jgi:gas vesicle protein
MKFSKDHSALTTVGLLSGLAVGAVVAALFAPKSGSEFREDIAERIKGMFGHCNTQKAVEIKPNAIEDLRLHTKEVADQLSAAPLEGLVLEIGK